MGDRRLRDADRHGRGDPQAGGQRNPIRARRSGSLAGLIITTHGLFTVLTSPLAGPLIDRYGPRRPYVLSLVLYALAGGAGLVVDSFAVLLASRGALGVAVAFVYTSITVLICNLFEDERKDQAMGL